MAAKCDDQLNFLSSLGVAEPPPRNRDHLSTPLSREEQRRFGRLYAENIRLIKYFSGKLYRKYKHCISIEDIHSCVDFASIKAFRAWNPDRGKLSTILWSFAQGEVLHFLRGHNWGLYAPHKVRELGGAARRLLDRGIAPDVVCAELGCSVEQLKEALVATAGIAHDQHGFDLHASREPTPMEWLEAREEAGILD